MERRNRAVQSSDSRFDGHVVVADCATACERCRPGAAPGSPQWAVRADTAARAMRLIADGTVEREGVAGVAGRLGCTTEQLRLLLQDQTGAGPSSQARAQRVETARILMENTHMGAGDIAFAAGFSGARQLEDTMRATSGSPPAELRRRARVRSDDPAVGARSPATVSLRLPTRAPFAFEGLFGHLGASVVPGCEEVRDGAYRRTLRLPFGDGIVCLRPESDHVGCVLTLDDLRDVTPAIARCRRLLDLDADPQEVIQALSCDPDLAEIVAASPGQRIPRTVDEAELAIRAVLGQQVSMKAARTHAGRLVAAYGDPVDDVNGALTHTFPSVDQLGDIDPAYLAVPAARRRTIVTLVAALADGAVELDVGCDWAHARARLLALPGIGPWTVEMIALRALGDPDSFPASDLGLRLAAEKLGLPIEPRKLLERSRRWSPWRSYATQHLWTTLDHQVNHWPVGDSR